MAKSSSPPKWVNALLNKFLDAHLSDAIIGDLSEAFFDDLEHHGYSKARRRYIAGALGFFRYYRFKKKGQFYQSRLNAFDMFFNYLKTSLRSFSKRRAYFLLNILGLSIGIASFLAIQKYVQFEKSFDRFHNKPDEVKRVLRYDSNNNSYMVGSDPDVAVDLKAGIPGFSAVTRFYQRDNGAFQVEENGRKEVYEDLNLLYADTDFFSVFKFDFLHGNSQNSLEKPNGLILTESMALRFFGQVNVVGKSVSFKDPNFPMISASVIAVVKDVPKNSHFSFEAILSMSTQVRNGQRLDQLGWNAFDTYARINENFQETQVQTQLEAIARNHFVNKENISLHLQTLTDIHLGSTDLQGIEGGTDKRLISYLSFTSVFILLMAYFNYINFSTAKSLERAREVGVRKVLGSGKWHLVSQFLVETFLINFFSLLVALVLLMALAPLIPIRSIGFGWETLFQFYGDEAILLTSALVLGTMISGFYPALLMSSWSPSVVLRGKLSGSSGGKVMRSVLTTAQSIVSLALVVITTVIYSQVNFMISQDKGMNIDHTLVVETPTITGDNYRTSLQTYRNKLLAHPYVKSVSTASTLPGNTLNYETPIRFPNQPVRESVRIYTDGIDEQFIQHYDIDLLAGRGFDMSFGNERANALLNKTAADLMGFSSPEEALQKLVIMEGDTVRVIGVIDDYHHFSLKQGFTPQILRYYGTWIPHFSVKVNYNESTQWSDLIEKMEEDYYASFGENLFTYRFLDQSFNAQYEEDRQFGNISGFFSAIAITIAILGLLGFVAFTISVRSKEIAIRKVLGAKKRSIIFNLSKNTLILNILAGVVASTFSYYYLTGWLDQYAFQMDLTILHFALPVIGLLAVVVLVIVIQSLGLLTKNPISAINNDG
ncbi:MAG: FtsX-like permease family protein [Roseivirga sp.]|nr:FtsX-like permease family protein [Roseivirga sp.]